MSSPGQGPELTLILPLYNEEAAVSKAVPELACALDARGWDWELVLVVNGSRDATPERCRQLALAFPRCRVVSVPTNRGYGNGVLAGLGEARGRWVGFMAGDGQIPPEDACRVASCALEGRADLVKAVRERRSDSSLRRFVSRGYNAVLRLFFRVGSPDTHGIPKFVRLELLGPLQLRSRDWFLDDEVMIKAKELGLVVEEIPVAWRERVGGRSHVRAGAVLEFLVNLFVWRVWRLGAWQRETRKRLLKS